MAGYMRVTKLIARDIDGLVHILHILHIIRMPLGDTIMLGAGILSTICILCMMYTCLCQADEIPEISDRAENPLHSV